MCKQGQILRVTALCTLFAATGWGGFAALAQEKKPDETPRILLSLPLGITRGVASKVVFRGLRLDGVTTLKIAGSETGAKILKHEKTAVPQKQEAARVGDTQVEAELTLPADLPPGKVVVVAVSPAGASQPFELLVDAQPPLAEKEPNDGFSTAQPLVVGETLEGAIHAPQNVDVFRFEGTAGQKIVAEVLAARHGAGLDPILTLYGTNSRLLAVSDDAEGADSRLAITLPATGVYFLSLVDAHDQGGPAHGYRLTLRLSP